MNKNKPASIYPAVGRTQVAVGRINGIWATWYIRNGWPGKPYYSSTRDEAFELFDDFVDVIKAFNTTKEQGHG